jgi:hypothetical protein
MFSKMKNIDLAFHVGYDVGGCRKWYGRVVLLFIRVSSSQMQDKVYILAIGKALEAYASDRRDNIPVLGARDACDTA